MVLERAAKMAAEATDTSSDDTLKQRGMRLAADFMNQKTTQLTKVLAEEPKEQHNAIRLGMIETLLRNIVLPRNELLIESSMLALNGLQELEQSSGQLSAICNEVKQIIEQYNQHKEQMANQLDDAIRQQLEQKLIEQGVEAESLGAINPASHPQYQEEMSKMLTDLNGQYNQALDQRKEMIFSTLS